MKVNIADHAMLRYIERVLGISLDSVRQEIEKIVTGPAKAGATTTTVDGFTYCFVEHADGRIVVTTILSNEMRRNQYVKNCRKHENRKRFRNE